MRGGLWRLTATFSDMFTVGAMIPVIATARAAMARRRGLRPRTIAIRSHRRPWSPSAEAAVARPSARGLPLMWPSAASARASKRTIQPVSTEER